MYILTVNGYSRTEPPSGLLRRVGIGRLIVECSENSHLHNCHFARDLFHHVDGDMIPIVSDNDAHMYLGRKVRGDPFNVGL